MENEKRKLYSWEKWLCAVAMVMSLVLLILHVLSFFGYVDTWIQSLFWMSICALQIVGNIVRWETHTKHNVAFIWVWSVLLVVNVASLGFYLIFVR